MFGKLHSGVATTLLGNGKKKLVGCKKIGVQPTALARRKILAGGKHRVGSGRPLSSARSEGKSMKRAPFYSGVATTLLGNGKKKLVGCKKIGVQPTALARRKILAGGKHRVGSGRPLSSARSEGKSMKRAPFYSQIMPRKKASHSLATKCCFGQDSLCKVIGHSASFQSDCSISIYIHVSTII